MGLARVKAANATASPIGASVAAGDLPSHDRGMLAMLRVAAFASMVSMRCADSILPALAREFGTTPASAASVISSFALAYGALQLLFGPLGDRYGKHRVIAFATLACTLGAACAVFAPSLTSLQVCRFLSGAAAAGIVPLTMAWVGDNVTYERRQEILAQLLGATVSGMIAGQWLGGVIADVVGWRAVFVLLAMLFAGTGLFMVMKNRAMPASLPTGRVEAHFFAGIFALGRSSWPRKILAITFVEGMLAFGALAFVPSYLHERFDLSMSLSGAVLAVYGVGGFVYTRAARLLVRAVGETRLVLLGGTLLAVAYAVLAGASHWAWALPACAIGGFGFYAMHGTLQTHATQMAPRIRGTAMSAFSCFLFLGQSLGVVIAATLIRGYSAPPMFQVAAVGLLALSGSFIWLVRRHAADATEA